MSSPVQEGELPSGALLEIYRVDGGHVDCFVADVPGVVALADLITAFYCSGAFLPERWLLGAVLGKRADDADVARLAAGQTERFSAWTVEGRRGDEILLCDYQGKTRSWLKVATIQGGTRLYFGSAVVPAKNRTDKAAFTLLLGVHRWYSLTLLRGAVRQLDRNQRSAAAR
jgi:hypothetical protein